jgi:transposase
MDEPTRPDPRLGRRALFNRLKAWRGLATRYDKHALIYRGGLVLAAILLWLR